MFLNSHSSTKSAQGPSGDRPRTTQGPPENIQDLPKMLTDMSRRYQSTARISQRSPQGPPESFRDHPGTIQRALRARSFGIPSAVTGLRKRMLPVARRSTLLKSIHQAPPGNPKERCEGSSSATPRLDRQPACSRRVGKSRFSPSDEFPSTAQFNGVPLHEAWFVASFYILDSTRLSLPSASI